MQTAHAQGELVTVEVTALAAGGDAVARLEDGRVVFVSDAVPGDRIEARLVHVKKDHAFGKVHRLLEASPHRVVPPCPVADRCGSCQWQQVDYRYQLEAKRHQVSEALAHIGGLSAPPVEAVIPQANPFGYRNKSTFPVGRDGKGRVVIGYYRKDSHVIVPLDGCPIQDARLDPLIGAVREVIEEQRWSVYNERRHEGAVRHVGLRIGERTGQMLLTWIVNAESLPGMRQASAQLMRRFPSLVGVMLNIHQERGNAIFGPQTRLLTGQSYIEEIFDGFTFKIEPTTFFQVCTSQAEQMARLVVEAAAAGPEDTVIDAYCGIGTLTLPLARQARQVTGIESHPRSIAQARANAQANALTNVRFLAGEVEALLPDLSADVVVVDPPRKGCDPSVLEAIVRLAPRRLVYVSCNPATLARDIKLLVAGGFRLDRVQPVDLFAQTCHVESVATLVREAV